MSWFWTVLAALWTWGVAAYAVWLWRFPDRWKREGKRDNGLGMVIKIDPNRLGTRIWLGTHKVFAAVGFVMAVVGGVLTVVWFTKAVSETFS
jgi:hypothetical protein